MPVAAWGTCPCTSRPLSKPRGVRTTGPEVFPLVPLPLTVGEAIVVSWALARRLQLRDVSTTGVVSVPPLGLDEIARHVVHGRRKHLIVDIAPEALQVGLHVAHAQVLPPRPLVNQARNLPEALGVAAAGAGGAGPAHDEHEAVDHLVQERGDEQAAVVARVAQDGRRQHDERLPTAEQRAAAQGRGADDVARVPLRLAARVAPVPGDAAGEAAAEEELVGGGEDAAQGGVVEGEGGGAGARRDERAEDALGLRVREAAAVGGEVRAHEGRGGEVGDDGVAAAAAAGEGVGRGVGAVAEGREGVVGGGGGGDGEAGL
ncbi:hypothetical protein TOPH_04079, partial [Tolypocladium ophioglossoides CBS 100239]